jgi:hypothetical protein
MIIACLLPQIGSNISGSIVRVGYGKEGQLTRPPNFLRSQAPLGPNHGKQTQNTLLNHSSFISSHLLHVMSYHASFLVLVPVPSVPIVSLHVSIK